MSEEEEFEFRLRLEREQAQRPADVPSPEGRPFEAKPPRTPATTAEKIAANPATRMFTGAARPLIGGLEYINQAIHKVVPGYPPESPLGSSLRQLDIMAEKGKEEQGLPTKVLGGAAEFGGQVLSPAYLKIMKALGPAKGLMGRIGQGATLGAAAGTLEPVDTADPEDYWAKKYEQQLTGLGVGGVFPPLLSLGKLGGQAADQFTRPFAFRNTKGGVFDTLTGGKLTPGIEKDLREIYGDLAGDSRQRIQSALSRQAGKTISGEKKTVAQVLAEQESRIGQVTGLNLQKMEKDLSKATATGDILPAIEASQKAGRAAAIDKIAGTKIAQQSNIATRDINKDIFYKKAFKSGFPIKRVPNPYMLSTGPTIRKTRKLTQTTTPDRIPDAGMMLSGMQKPPVKKQVSIGYSVSSPKTIKDVIKGDDELKSLFKNPFIRDAMPTAKKLSEADGVIFEVNPTAYLHNIKLAIDDQLKVVGDSALKGTTRNKVMAVKNQLIALLAKRNPDYDKARLKMIEDSLPIDKQNVGLELKKILTSPLDKEKGATMATAIADPERLLKKTTGGFYKDLKSIIPEHEATVNRVVDELQTKATLAANQAKKQGVGGLLKESVEPMLPTLLHRPTMLANYMLKQVGKNMGPVYEKMAIKLQTDPKLMNEILKRPANDAERKILEQLMSRLAVVGASQQAAEDR